MHKRARPPHLFHFRDGASGQAVCEFCELLRAHRTVIGLLQEKTSWEQVISMAHRGRETRSFYYHVQDCQLWAEIRYLDSVTDYREYLPQSQVQRESALCADLVFLDQSISHSKTKWILPTAVTIGGLSLCVAGYLFYLFVQGV